MITVVVKQPGEAPVIKQIDGSVESIQAEVGGYFETHRLQRYTVYCNEEGTRKYMAPNIHDACHGAVLVGPVLVMRGDNGLVSHYDAQTVQILLNEASVLAHA